MVTGMSLSDLHLAGLSERQLLLLIIERQYIIMADITALQSNIASLTAIVVQVGPVLQANTDLGTRIIGVLEDIRTQLGNTGPTQADIDLLNTAVTDALATIRGDVTQVNATNQALQDEIAKATTTPTPPSTAQRG